MRTEDLTKLRLPSGKRSMYFFIGFSLPKAMRFRFSVTNHFRKNRLSSNLFNHDINCKKSYKNKQSTEGNFSRCFVKNYIYLIKSLITSPAMIRPATDGTNAVLPGTCLRWVHFLSVSGGHMQFVLQLIAISSTGVIGFSFE